MKKIFLVALAVCAMFASCSKDNEGTTAGEPKNLLVQFPKGTTYAEQTRTVETPATATTETSLTNAIVFLMNGNSVVKVEEVTPSEIIGSYKKFDNVPASVSSVIVVANVSTSDKTALLLKTTRSSIENYPFTVASQTSVGVTGKTLMGKTDTFVSGTPNPTPGDTDDYFTAEVDLDAISARFEIGNVVKGINVKNVKLEGVWINNFPMTYKASPLTLYLDDHASWNITPAANIVGSTTPLVPSAIPTYLPGEYHIVHDASVDGTTKVYAFQLFAGAYVPHVVALVSGQYDNNDYFLGWLTFNKFNDGSTDITEVENNMIYKVGAMTVNGGDITIDPELDGFDLGFECEITPWTAKNVTPGIE